LLLLNEAFTPPWAATEWERRGWTFDTTQASTFLFDSSTAALSPVSPPPTMTTSCSKTS